MAVEDELADVSTRALWLLLDYEGLGPRGGCPECFGPRHGHRPGCELDEVLQALWEERMQRCPALAALLHPRAGGEGAS